MKVVELESTRLSSSLNGNLKLAGKMVIMIMVPVHGGIRVDPFRVRPIPFGGRNSKSE